MREAVTGAFQQFCRDGQVDGCRGRTDVAQERGKIQQTCHRIDACPVPTQQSSNRERMAETMQVRWRHAGGDCQLQRGQQFVECPANRVGANRRAPPLVKGESRGLGRDWPEPRLFTIQKAGDRTGHLWPEWHQAIFSKLRLANDQKLVIQIDVLTAQPRHLPEPTFSPLSVSQTVASLS